MPELQEVLPKYLQVAKHYRDQIMSGALEPGAEIPSERQLASQWGISRPTATKALAELRNQGLVESRQGSGTHVRGMVQFNRRARDRYLRSREAGRIYAPGERAEIVGTGIVKAPPWVSEAFDGAEQAIRRHRITFTDDVPSEVSTSWLTADLADQAPLLLRRERIRAGTLAYVEQSTGRKPTYARDQVSARLATAVDRRELGLDAKTAAVLIVRHMVFDAEDRPLECVEAIYPPDRWSFEQEYLIR